MTCIVGIAHEGKVYMGGDRCGAEYSPGWVGSKKISVTRPKVFIRHGMAFGYTSSFLMGSLLEHVLQIPSCDGPGPTMSVHEYVCSMLVPAISECFTKGGYNTVKDGRSFGGYFLLGLRGHLFTVQEDFAAIETADGYAAVGSGAENAIGALHVTPTFDPLKRIHLALDAAACHATGVAPPFDFITLPKET